MRDEKRWERWPTIEALREHARVRAPRFTFEYADGGAGSDDGIARNRRALDAIELVSRCGILTELPCTDVQLFGRSYAAPIGVSPMGAPSIVLPGADVLLAEAAQAARIPYTLGFISGATIEEVAKIAPDVFWFQIYRCAGEYGGVALDLMRRAQSAGAHALVITLDVPMRTLRPRELKAGLGGNAFRPNFRMLLDIAMSPQWAMAMLRHGQPRFANLRQYAGPKSKLNDVIRFARKALGGPLSWAEIERYRDAWKGPMIVKGILHPEDAEKAVSIGADGVLVSNHGGRQFEALPAAIDCLPAVAAAVGSRAAVLMDSGVRSGADVVRALALGAKAAFAGKAFLWGLAALGSDGPKHVIELFSAEIRSALAQLGVSDPAKARSIAVRHPNALRTDFPAEM
jgi:L-lactate dehydrogenase (cytochrome)